ncbi:hypothetical protein INR49_026155 [Caranx melampygus]|nr:hypothetical protein INR49_026155 [Caranx melampygus]
MEMAHACQGRLGGMTSKITDVIGCEVKPALRRGNDTCTERHLDKAGWVESAERAADATADQSSSANGSTNTFLLFFPAGFCLLADAVHGLFVPYR